MIINIQNLESIILNDQKFQKLLPEQLLVHWKFAVKNGLNSIAKKTLLDILDSLNENILSEYFGCTITLNKIDYSIVKNITLSVNDHDFEIAGFDNFFATRDKEQVYISLWR